VSLAPTARWVLNARNGGGTYDAAYPWRIVLHTIEGSSSASLAGSHAYPPHVWYDPATRVLLQTVPFDRSSFALYSDGVTPTNKARALQVEISGQAQTAGDWPAQWLDNLAEDVIVPMCQFVATQGGSIDLADIPAPGAIDGSASASAAQRMTLQRWASFRGICGHRHVPTNDHWDPGAMDVARIAAHAAYIIGAMLDPAAIDDTGDDEVTKAYTAPDGSLVLVSGLEYVAIDPNRTPWPTAHKGLVDLAASGQLAKHGDELWKPISAEALSLLKKVG
jgi:hypothetical protein